MRDSSNYSSASMSEYIHWVLRDKLGLNNKETRDNLCLVSALAEVEFTWRHPMDENRAIDGLELRSDFEYETGKFLDKSSGLMGKCTFFEMVAGLSIRCEELMRNPMIGNRTSKWFFEFLDNLDLLGCDDRDVEYIVDTCERFMSGKQDMFPIHKKSIKQSNEQIWKQLTAYLNEKYLNEGDDLALYS